MRNVLLVAGVALIPTGIVWILQGMDVLKGSFMTGSGFWLSMGVLAVLLGIPAIIRGLRRT
jgi:hypothetical protein